MRSSLRRAAAALLLATSAGCTYSSSASTSWEDRPIERRTETWLGEAQAGAGDAVVRALLLGGEPTVELVCSAPIGQRTLVERRITPAWSRRHAHATLVVENALNENLLVYGLGWVVLAPVWVPIQYQVRAHGAASDALTGPEGVRTTSVGDNPCVVEAGDDVEVDDDESSTESAEEVLAPAPGPLRGVEVLIRGPSGELTYVTDASGRIALPMRSLIALGAASSFEVVVAPSTEFARTLTCSLAASVPTDRLADAARAVVAPPIPQAWLSEAPGAATPDMDQVRSTAERALAAYDAGDLAAALDAAARARSLAPAGSRAQADLGALFTLWAAAWPVECTAARAGARPERMTYGARALPIPGSFTPGVMSQVLVEPGGEPFTFRFVAR